jgi:hypothetical protein
MLCYAPVQRERVCHSSTIDWPSPVTKPVTNTQKPVGNPIKPTKQTFPSLSTLQCCSLSRRFPCRWGGCSLQPPAPTGPGHMPGSPRADPTGLHSIVGDKKGGGKRTKAAQTLRAISFPSFLPPHSKPGVHPRLPPVLANFSRGLPLTYSVKQPSVENEFQDNTNDKCQTSPGAPKKAGNSPG